MKDEQLSIFSATDKKESKNNASHHKPSVVSEYTMSMFQVLEIPFLGCNFDSIYPSVAKLLPNDEISYKEFPFDTAITCEIICAAICHQMNWDYLRKAVYRKTRNTPDWLIPQNLQLISEDVVADLFSKYPKKERIRKEERTAILREVGIWLQNFLDVKSVFLSSNNELLDINTIRNNISACAVFTNDPEEKKLQLLFQKLSSFLLLQGLKKYYKPAIDYHLIRCYTRRGLIMAKTKQGLDYLLNEDSKRKESTVAAIRQLCSDLMLSICQYTSLDVLTVNQIEWNVGRSVCVQNKPDCYLKCNDSDWLKPTFSRCPFFDTCTARIHNKELLTINEPTYEGSSY